GATLHRAGDVVAMQRLLVQRREDEEPRKAHLDGAGPVGPVGEVGGRAPDPAQRRAANWLAPGGGTAHGSNLYTSMGNASSLCRASPRRRQGLLPAPRQGS